jgi:hypothetical protein
MVLPGCMAGPGAYNLHSSDRHPAVMRFSRCTHQPSLCHTDHHPQPPTLPPPSTPPPQIPTAHRGFLARSRAINMDHLHQLAASSGKRLVLCGHSLGGAVATLCTLRLLRELEPLATPARWVSGR